MPHAWVELGGRVLPCAAATQETRLAAWNQVQAAVIGTWGNR